MQTAESIEVLEPAEIAKQLRVHERTVKRWLDDGKLLGARLPSGEWRITKSAYEAWLRERGFIPKAPES